MTLALLGAGGWFAFGRKQDDKPNQVVAIADDGAAKAQQEPKSGPEEKAPKNVEAEEKTKKLEPVKAPVTPPIPAPKPVPAQLPAMYAIEVDPPTALVEVEGNGSIEASIEGTGGRRTLHVPGADGRAEIKVIASLAGHHRVERTLRPAAGETASLRLRLEKLPPPPALIHLTVKPADAFIQVEGEGTTLKGTGGERELEIASADGIRKATVRASRSGFVDLRRELTPQAGETQSLLLRLSPKPAVYSVSLSPSSAALEIKGLSADIKGTGAKRDVVFEGLEEEGSATLLATLDGYAKQERELKPKPGDEQSLSLSLRPLPAVYELTLSPADAVVSHPGVMKLAPTGGAARMLTMEEPSAEEVVYKLRVTAEGHKGIERELRPRPGLNESLSITLDPLPKDEKIVTNSIGMKLVLIPAGEFEMGSRESADELAKAFDTKPEDFKDEYPLHKVRITRPFYLGQTEVTQGQWFAVMGTRPWVGKDDVQEGNDYPATYVSWDDAVEFCRRLSAKEDGKTYRLPTEAEWEWACRAGSQTRYSFGDSVDELPSYAWFDKNAWDAGEKYAHRVGQKKANAFGLFDMHGNVWEWCSDWYDEGYYARSPVDDPRGPDAGSARVGRGGGWLYRPRSARSAYRAGGTPGVRIYFIGFRVASKVQGAK